LCLVSAFPGNECDVEFRKKEDRPYRDLMFVDIKDDRRVTRGDIQDYLYPEVDYGVSFLKSGKIKVEGPVSVIKKLIFPKHFM
jgi:hypothetical protein